MKRYTIVCTDGKTVVVNAEGLNVDPDMLSFYLLEANGTARRIAWFMKHSVMHIREEAYVEQAAAAPRSGARRS